MQSLAIFQKNDADIVFQFFDPTPADDAPARCLASAGGILSDSFTPLTLDFRALPQDPLEMLGGLHTGEDDTLRITPPARETP